MRLLFFVCFVVVVVVVLVVMVVTVAVMWMYMVIDNHSCSYSIGRNRKISNFCRLKEYVTDVRTDGWTDGLTDGQTLI